MFIKPKFKKNNKKKKKKKKKSVPIYMQDWLSKLIRNPFSANTGTSLALQKYVSCKPMYA